MSDSNVTKLALAESLKNLMARKTFSKIYVSDIAGNCGLTRQAFYYHFKDKYDLMNWIFVTETVCFMSTDPDTGHWMDGLKELCDYIQQNKAFYVNALNTAGQNSFPEYLHDYISNSIITMIRRTENVNPEEDKWSAIAEVIAVIMVGLIIRWVNNGMKEDPVGYITKLKSLFDGSLLYALEKQGTRIFREASE
jgi:probable dihydroxyacetone kinase regulator